jgi:hypothetical protein
VRGLNESPHVRPAGSDFRERSRDFVPGLDVDRDVRSAAEETREKMIGLLDHQVHIERFGCAFRDRVHKGRAK